MKRMAVLALSIGCGGGPSIDTTQPGAIILSADCTLLGETTLVFDVEYQVSLAVGNEFRSVIQFLGEGQILNRSGFMTCGFWDSIGDDGCHRRAADDPASDQVTQSLTIDVSTPQPQGVDSTVIVNVFESLGSQLSIGGSDLEDVDCI